MAYHGIHQLVNFWQWEVVFGIGFIQVSKIYVYLSLLVGIFNQNNIEKPSGIVHAPYEVNFQQLINFYLNSLITLCIECSSFLVYRVTLRSQCLADKLSHASQSLVCSHATKQRR